MVWKTLAVYCKVSASPATMPAPTANKFKGLQKPHLLTVANKFIDRVRLKVQGGAGGSGYPKINGFGGSGGNVYIMACDGIDMKHIYKCFPNRRVKAGAGGNSRPHVILGEIGQDVTIEVPTGVTVAVDETGGQRKIADLTKPDEKVLVARGGEGGHAKNGFHGRKGCEANITLYLKLIADIGFVGYPNAGKSTLLRGLSRAKPKVANYPFTTIRPNLGIMEFEDFRQISCADLPGLIEGAHRNRGLGHNFLRHIERTSLLMFIVDIQGFQLNERAPFRSAFQTIMSLNKELELYREDLIHKPSVLVINKMDTDDAESKAEQLKRDLFDPVAFNSLSLDIKPKHRIDFREMVFVAAKDMANIDDLKEKLRIYLDDVYEESRAANDLNKPLLASPPSLGQLT